MKLHRALLAMLVICAVPVMESNAQSVIVRPKDYIGASSDTKPTGGRAGSTYYENDTGRMFVYDGSSWALKYYTAIDGPDTLSTATHSIAVSVAGIDEVAFGVEISGAVGDTLTFGIEGKMGDRDWESITRTSITNIQENTFDFVYSVTDSTFYTGATGVAKLDSTRFSIVDIEDLIQVVIDTRRITTLK